MINVNDTIYRVFLTEANSFPYTLIRKGRRLSVSNNDTANELTITLTTISGSVSVPIPPASAFDGFFDSFSVVDKSGSATDYNIGIGE